MNHERYAVALCLVYGALGVGGLILFHSVNGNPYGAGAALLSAAAAYASSNALLVGRAFMYEACVIASLVFAVASFSLMVF
ncbi:hypothetical protein [Candidatus Phyllobacterium onerii]|uniref:hypothetical protein n=1 Tax=Candidatus Phyllobacterium onerii TaxID=3020828 RepID=UPI00232E0D4A|nr:hypothetical protein [Phyllobacterium sp. IY22]